MFVEASVDGSNGRFHFHQHWKLGKFPPTSMENTLKFTSFHASKSATTEMLPWKVPRTSMEVDLRQIYFHGSSHVSMEVNLLPWKLPTISMEVDRKTEIVWRTSLTIIK